MDAFCLTNLPQNSFLAGLQQSRLQVKAVTASTLITWPVYKHNWKMSVKEHCQLQSDSKYLLSCTHKAEWTPVKTYY
jgi:hypothetical protein